MSVALGQIGYRDELRADAAQDIVAKRGDQALEWVHKQIQDIRRDPAVKNIAAVLGKRLSLGLHDPVNDPPPSARDHDAGHGIRVENTRAAEDRRAADPDYQLRRIRGMYRGDGKTPEQIAATLGLPLSEVNRIISKVAPQALATERSGFAPRRLQAV